MLPVLREAVEAELADWDRWTVATDGGDVFQSRAWAMYQATRGLVPRFLIDEWGGRTLALERPWLLLDGGTAYLPRGPVGSADDPQRGAARVRAISDWLGRDGVDALSSDAEVPAASGYGQLLARHGFAPAEEVQPSRHRLSIPVGDGATEAACLANLSISARQRVRGAIRLGLIVTRYDAQPAAVDNRGLADAPAGALAADALAATLEQFYAVLLSTSMRRGFTMAPPGRFLDWSTRAIGAAHALYLEVRAPGGPLLAGALLYRHGRRLTYATAGDVAAARRAYPGAIHLLLWRALQICLAERRDELDLGGVDVRGARTRPVPGSPMHGLLAFKESFGGQWIELAGNHRRLIHPARYAVAQAADALVGVSRRVGIGGLTREPASA